MNVRIYKIQNITKHMRTCWSYDFIRLRFSELINKCEMGDSSVTYQKVCDSDDLVDDNNLNQCRPRSQISLDSYSSDESLPVKAPLVRQPRCSIDIDLTEPMVKPKRKIGMTERLNTYLDSMQLSDSIQEIS